MKLVLIRTEIPSASITIDTFKTQKVKGRRNIYVKSLKIFLGRALKIVIIISLDREKLINKIQLWLVFEKGFILSL